MTILAGCGASSDTGDPHAPREAIAAGPSAAQERLIVDALEVARRACGSGRPDPAERASIDRAVQTLSSLFRRFPTQGFRLRIAPDESAHMLSVLLLARYELSPCAPSAVAAIDRALPAGVGPGAGSP